jgi:ATP-dependent DNA helicase RecQ
MDQIAAGEFKLVYAAPERLRQTPFLHLMNAAEVSRLVVDEAHCVSVWGHDFRPDYLIIARARAALGNPPLIAVTATAPPRVRRDIVQQFGEMQVVVGDSTRPNLQYEVFHARNADEKLAHLLAFCTSVPGSGIVYAGTRKRCERLAALLRRYGVAAEHYHAGIPNRAAVQDAFMSGRTRVVVATIAFGMGIDKADVRFIVHYVPPDSLESYYQQAGRAGRDGQPSRCLLMYSSSDRGTLTRHAREGVLPVEYLRGVYGAVKQQLNGQDLGVLNAEMLTRALNSNDIDVRVALSLLEEAELLYRGPDLPRNVRVTLLASPPPPALAPYAEALGLLTPTRTTLPIARVVEQTDLTLDSAEAALLRWADAGWIDYDPDRRDVALRLLPPPDDAAERVAVLLERHETIQGQRVDEISAYAETGRCRHGYINAYLGGAPVAQCTACDNCVRIPPPPDPGLPTEREQLQAILRLLANTHGWGRGSITSIMIGDVERAPDAGRRRKDFGRLAFRSRSAIGKLVRRLEKGGFLKSETLSHGGVAYAITARGRAALETPAKLDRLTRQRRPPKRPPRKMEPVGQRTLSGETVPVEAPPVDEELYETLRAWRNDLARQKHIPAYVIFANKTLTAIAAHKPETPGALERIKGVGPKKLARYGETVIQLVKHHRAQTPDPAP